MVYFFFFSFSLKSKKQRGGEVRDTCESSRARLSHRRGVRRQRHRQLFSVHHDEGPVRQLRGAEDDRRGRAGSAQDTHAQNTAPHSLVEKVHVRQAHSGQAGEVFAQEQRVLGHPLLVLIYKQQQ